jgi:hypothetical protein
MSRGPYPQGLPTNNASTIQAMLGKDSLNPWILWSSVWCFSSENGAGAEIRIHQTLQDTAAGAPTVLLTPLSSTPPRLLSAPTKKLRLLQPKEAIFVVGCLPKTWIVGDFCYFPNGKSTIWGIYSDYSEIYVKLCEYVLFFWDP